MIKLTNLTKRYGDFTAVNGINLEVPAGQLFGFLGPNGAGKTARHLFGSSETKEANTAMALREVSRATLAGHDVAA